jgi:coenzyme PQQ precursor peptide PqqA
MTWTTPTLVEICIGLEINGYLPAELQEAAREFARPAERINSRRSLASSGHCLHSIIRRDLASKLTAGTRFHRPGRDDRIRLLVPPC